MSSGPNAGFGKIILPAKQNGSSIMPGKVNPVIPEVVNQVAFLVIGHDLTITMADTLNTLRINCIDGIQANEERCQYFVEHSVGIITALNSYLGYKKSASIAKEALKSGKSIKQIVLEKGYLDEETLNKALDAYALTQPHTKK